MELIESIYYGISMNKNWLNLIEVHIHPQVACSRIQFVDHAQQPYFVDDSNMHHMINLICFPSFSRQRQREHPRVSPLPLHPPQSGGLSRSSLPRILLRFKRCPHCSDRECGPSLETGAQAVSANQGRGLQGHHQHQQAGCQSVGSISG